MRLRQLNNISIIQSGLFFLTGSVAAAALNYLYQVIASIQLPVKDFADLNGWVANLAVFFIAGGILQYYSNFHPANRSTMRKAIFVFNLFGAVALVTWRMTPEPFSFWHSAIMVIFSMIAGWLMGQLQIRLQLVALSTVSFLIGLARVLTAVTSVGVPDNLGKFVAANLVSGLVGLWFLSWKLWPAEKAQNSQGFKEGMWKNAVLLSAAGSIIPQFDMFLMNHTQPAADFAAFARASLIGRAVYALTVILAQWLLPRQIRGENPKLNIPLWQIVVAVLALCGVFAGASPFISEYILRWDSTPSMRLVFFASAEISMLGIIFLLVQASCSQHRLRRAGFLLGLLAVEATVQLIFKFPMEIYLPAALFIQIAGILAPNR